MFAFYLFVAALIAALSSVVFFVGICTGKLEKTAENRGISTRTLVIACNVLIPVGCLAWPILLPGLMYNQYKIRASKL